MSPGRKKKWFLACGVLPLLVLVLLPLSVRRVLLGPQGSYFDSAGVRIHYTDEGHGTPVLLVHGFANPAHLQWRRTGRIAALSKEYRVIALDNRGHGRSGKPRDPGQYGIQMVEDLVRLLDHLKIQKAHVVGYSMGGFITLKMIATHPERIISAAACGAGWERATQENRDFAEAVARAVEKGEAGPLPKRLGIADRPLSFREKLGVKLSLGYFNAPRALAAAVRGSRELTLTEEELRANRIPTLTIIGSQDGLLPDAKALHAQMANHELLILEGKNHMNTDVSGAFVKALDDFLRKHTPEKADSSPVMPPAAMPVPGPLAGKACAMRRPARSE